MTIFYPPYFVFLYSGAVCPQDWATVERLYTGVDLVKSLSVSEDCLYLEVYTPSLTARRPVMVWIHGGGFAIGEKTSSVLNDDNDRFLI